MAGSTRCEKMVVRESPRYSRDYLDPQKRSVSNALQVLFRNGEKTERVEVQYPLGHPRRREELLPALREKCAANLSTRLAPARARKILDLFDDAGKLDAMDNGGFLNLFGDGR